MKTKKLLQKKSSKTRTTKKVSLKKRTRHYDNSAREQKSVLNRQKIIESYVDLIVASSGHEVTLQELAKKTGISLRTLFRFFGDKDKLNEEIEIYLARYLSPISNEISKMSLPDYAAFSYEVFDRYEKLVKAYLYTNLGQISRRVLRRKFQEMLTAKMIADISKKRGTKPEDFKPDDLMKVRFAANLISAQIWSEMKEGYGLSGKNVAPAAKWAVQTLLKDLYITL